MYDEELYDNEQAQVIAKCEECGGSIYDDSGEIYIDAKTNYYCCLDCALNYYGIHLAEDCLVPRE